MLQNAYLLAKFRADTAENEQHFAEILLKIGNYRSAYNPASHRAPYSTCSHRVHHVLDLKGAPRVRLRRRAPPARPRPRARRLGGRGQRDEHCGFRRLNTPALRPCSQVSLCQWASTWHGYVLRSELIRIPVCTCRGMGWRGFRVLGVVLLRRRMKNELNFPPNFEGLVLGCIDADFCK